MGVTFWQLPSSYACQVNDSFEAHRARLMAVAYRMLGSAAEAEDAVQDTWLRWQGVDGDSVRDPAAWLCKAISRICIDRLTSARARRETYPGSWLPEPVSTTTPVDIESISLGFLVLLERLTPLERAVFVLHRVFDYSHSETGDALGISEAASRQALHRASTHIAAGKPRFDSTRAAHERLLNAFADALAQGDVATIASVLAEDATLYGDAGGKVRGAIERPIVGRDRVSRFFAGILAKTTLAPDLVVTVEDVNGWPALVGRTGAGVSFVLSIETDGTHIITVQNVVNPDKLTLRHVD
jgi:RNA polymerase sigma-70 factor, ECF subfamily